ncbi:response regulator [Geitlerinema sp. CS-897]|nr:response regulator [Geitlerinema sp. CS-897]
MNDERLKADAKLLVIEDDATTRLLLRKILQQEGYEVVLAKNGIEGLDKAIELSPSVVISDWVMPGLDGIEVCRRLRANADLSGTFLILLSSRETVSDRVQGLDAGADEFLSKPIDPNELKARVRAGLRQYQLHRQLSVANSNLVETLQKLQQAQARLIQSEKMSSLGQMVAGIAHEINNPINFIEGNLSFAKDYLQDLLAIIELYQKYHSPPETEIQDKLDEVDLQFLIEDSDRLIESMRFGATRIHQIVKHLKNFVRLDEAEMKRVDVHDGLKSTLIMLQNRIKFEGTKEIKIVEKYDKLPKVDCYPGQLNQVFLNILNNAVYFLHEYTRKHIIDDPIVKIETELIRERSEICITISNNGPSISEDVRPKVFDPFFTTKPVGKGTGMGLSICYQIIVERHGGQLSCVVPPEGGTAFIIELPLEQEDL